MVSFWSRFVHKHDTHQNLSRFWSPPISFWSRFAGETNICSNPARRHIFFSSKQINAVAHIYIYMYMIPMRTNSRTTVLGQTNESIPIILVAFVHFINVICPLRPKHLQHREHRTHVEMPLKVGICGQNTFVATVYSNPLKQTDRWHWKSTWNIVIVAEHWIRTSYHPIHPSNSSEFQQVTFWKTDSSWFIYIMQVVEPVKPG